MEYLYTAGLTGRVSPAQSIPAYPEPGINFIQAGF
jgi:hypothetical protein